LYGLPLVRTVLAAMLILGLDERPVVAIHGQLVLKIV
jgi:hypothetical protein